MYTFVHYCCFKIDTYHELFYRVNYIVYVVSMLLFSRLFHSSFFENSFAAYAGGGDRDNMQWLISCQVVAMYLHVLVAK